MKCKCGTKPLPYMLVPKQKSKDRRNSFTEGDKYKALSSNLGKAENKSLYYKAEHFKDLLLMVEKDNKLHIYFTAENEYLSILFGIYKGKTEKYYRIDYNIGVMEVKHDNAVSLTKAYRDNKMSILNRYKNPKNVSDTVCITHDFIHVMELIIEMDCQAPTAVVAYFFNYLPNEVTNPADPRYLYSMQLGVEFCFRKIIDGVEQDFYIDDCEEYSNRSTITVAREEQIDNQSLMFNFNNGSLCPPCKNCDDDGVLLNTDGCL